MTANESRFFPGHVWCSDEPTCRRGLAVLAASRGEAAAKFVSTRRRNWSSPKSYDVWTMLSVDDVPTLVTVILSPEAGR